MSFSESLTVRILGDSSSLRQELESAAEQIDALQARLAAGSGVGPDLARMLLPLEGAVRPLESLSALVERVRGQLAALSGTPVTLNVAPAMGALQQLVAMMQQAAAQMRFLGTLSGGGAGVAAAAPVRGFASGGLVTGPTGVDNITARLTAGEFVLSREAVAALGEGTLSRWNRWPHVEAATPRRLPAPDLPRTPVSEGRNARSSAILAAHQEPAPHSTLNYGGVSIQVRESADVTGLLRDLRRDGIVLRNRRG